MPGLLEYLGGLFGGGNPQQPPPAYGNPYAAEDADLVGTAPAGARSGGGILGALFGGGGDSTRGGLYGDALTADQQAAIRRRGLLSYLEPSMGKSYSLDPGDIKSPLSALTQSFSPSRRAAAEDEAAKAAIAAGKYGIDKRHLGLQEREVDIKERTEKDNAEALKAAIGYFNGPGILPGIGAPAAGTPASAGGPAGGSADTNTAAQLVATHESSNNPWAATGSPNVDLSKAPLDRFGFPQWAGIQTDKGPSHAAGLFQFQPGTWAKYAGPLGITDFSPQSQRRVFDAAYAAEGWAPWAPYNSRLSAALQSRGISPTGSGGGTGPAQAPAPVAPLGAGGGGGVLPAVTGSGPPPISGPPPGPLPTGAPPISGPPAAPQIRPPGAPMPPPGAALPPAAMPPGGAPPGMDPATRQAMALAIIGGRIHAPSLGGILTGSPGYQGQIQGAKTQAERAITEPSDIRINRAKTDEEIRKEQQLDPLKAAQARRDQQLKLEADGWRLQAMPDGTTQFTAVPGSPAAQKIQETTEKKALAEKQRVLGADFVVQDANRVGKLVEEAQLPTTGLGGQLLQNLPGTAAHDVSNLLLTIKSNITMDKLQAMRASSPTGGALGQVSDFENKLLGASIAALEQSQTKQQFLFNLNRVRDTYLDIVHGPNGIHRAGGSAGEPAAPPAAVPSAPAPPAVGEVRGGHKFLGGNPADPKNWQRQ